MCVVLWPCDLKGLQIVGRLSKRTEPKVSQWSIILDQLCGRDCTYDRLGCCGKTVDRPPVDCITLEGGFGGALVLEVECSLGGEGSFHFWHFFDKSRRCSVESKTVPGGFADDRYVL